MTKILFIDIEGTWFRAKSNIPPEPMFDMRQRWCLVNYLQPQISVEDLDKKVKELNLQLIDLDSQDRTYRVFKEERNARRTDIKNQLSKLEPLANYFDDYTGWLFHKEKNLNKPPKTFIATEVSCVVFDNSTREIVEALSKRVNYDIRELLNFDAKNYSTWHFSCRKYPNTFRSQKYYYNVNNTAAKIRQQIFNLLAKHNVGQIYAKGSDTENTWLFYPESCDGFTIPLSVPRAKFVIDFNYAPYSSFPSIVRRDSVLDFYKKISNFAHLDAIPRELTLPENYENLDKLIEPYIDQHFSFFETLFFLAHSTLTVV